jgi:hypothetical protein
MAPGGGARGAGLVLRQDGMSVMPRKVCDRCGSSERVTEGVEVCADGCCPPKMRRLCAVCLLLELRPTEAAS